MEEDVCSLELSRLAKEKGFDWLTTTRYYDFIGPYADIRKDWNNTTDVKDISAPSLCHLQKWVEESTDYVIDTTIDPILNTFSFIIYKKIIDYSQSFTVSFYKLKKVNSKNGFHYRSKALETALFEIIRRLP